MRLSVFYPVDEKIIEWEDGKNYPCLDIDRGRVVKGSIFSICKRPAIKELARAYDEAGADELVMLNITGSRSIALIHRACPAGVQRYFHTGDCRWGIKLSCVELLLQAGSSRVSRYGRRPYPELVKEAAEAFKAVRSWWLLMQKTRENYWEVCIQEEKVTGRNVLEWVKRSGGLGGR